jgi:hypothetical protein
VDLVLVDSQISKSREGTVSFLIAPTFNHPTCDFMLPSESVARWAISLISPTISRLFGVIQGYHFGDRACKPIISVCLNQEPPLQRSTLEEVHTQVITSLAGA